MMVVSESGGSADHDEGVVNRRLSSPYVIAVRQL